MELNIELLNRLRTIDWFSNCGKDVHVHLEANVIRLESMVEASQFYMDPYWEDVTLYVRNEFSQFLSDHFRMQFREWNVLVAAAKSFIYSEITPQLEEYRSINNLDQSFLDSVHWDIMHIIMADVYGWTNHDLRFYDDLLSVYEAGCFPCGWVGVYPEGSLVVY